MIITNEIKKSVYETADEILEKLRKMSYGKIDLSIDIKPERLIFDLIGQDSKLLRLTETGGN